MMRDRERVETWKLVFYRTDDIEQHQPKFWLNVQSVANQISGKGKGWQREEGYKREHQRQNKGKKGHKGDNWEKVEYKREYKYKDKNKREYKGKGNPQREPQNPFVASAQANQAAAAAATPVQAGPPYEFRGREPALQAAVSVAAAAAIPAAAQAAAPAVQSADVRKGGAQKMTFNVELVNGGLDVGVDKLGEVHKRSGM